MGEGECEMVSSEEPPKKSRHRKKHLYNTILQQMEFYFSDSNLSKDRFLSQLLSQSSAIDIEVFLKFNKIRKLNCSAEDIRKAIQKSELIGLSEDGLKVYRKKPIKAKENVDFCTIYVENIKADATHETLSQIFSDFGNVVYVSIPKYKHNKTNKGFAFVEYETEEQANKAISFFESIGCKIPTEKSPEELQSIKTFEVEQKNSEVFNESVSKMEIEQESKKRKRNSDIEDPNESTEENLEKLHGVEVLQEQMGTGEIKQGSKKKKRSGENEDNISKEQRAETKLPVLNKEDESIGKKKKKPVDKNNENKQDVSDKNQKIDPENTQKKDGDDTEEAKKKKKNKKDKRRTHIKELGMQVLSKKEWKKLRNKYLDLQKKKMKEFKQYLFRQKLVSKPSHRESEENFDEQPSESSEAKISFVPGVIVKLTLPEPCVDVKKLKADIKCVSPEVQYVDIPLPSGSEEVFIRFGCSSAASEFCTTDFNGRKIVLSGGEEDEYWRKIENDRRVKFQKMAKKQRGREKLLKKADKESAKHMRFEDNE